MRYFLLISPAKSKHKKEQNYCQKNHRRPFKDQRHAGVSCRLSVDIFV